MTHGFWIMVNMGRVPDMNLMRLTVVVMHLLRLTLVILFDVFKMLKMLNQLALSKIPGMGRNIKQQRLVSWYGWLKI